MKDPDCDKIAPDAIQYLHGGDDETLWTPADWAMEIADYKFEEHDTLDLLQRMMRMPHWQTVEWWMEAVIPYAVALRASKIEFDSDLQRIELCYQIRHSLFEIMDCRYSSWTKLHTYLGYSMGKKGELDSRIDHDGEVKIKDSVICLSGKFSLSDEHYRGLILEAGGIWKKDGITKADYLIAGEWASSSKLDYAEKKGIAIRGEAALRRALCHALWLEDAELDKIAPKMKELNPRPARKEIDWSQVEWKGICITGKLDKPRKVYHAAIKEAGGQPLENVTSKCELLVVGDDPGSKVEKAKAAGVPICTLDEFKEALAKRGISLP